MSCYCSRVVGALVICSGSGCRSWCFERRVFVEVMMKAPMMLVAHL